MLLQTRKTLNNKSEFIGLYQLYFHTSIHQFQIKSISDLSNFEKVPLFSLLLLVLVALFIIQDFGLAKSANPNMIVNVLILLLFKLHLLLLGIKSVRNKPD